MGYIVNPVYWLKTETDRVEGIVLMVENWSKTWTAATLQAYLEEKGIIYTVAQVELIGAELMTRGVLISD